MKASGRRGRSGLSRRWWKSAGHRQERRERLAQEPVSRLQESRRRRSPEIHVGCCNGGHGGTGGGGMGPPLTNQSWVYGSDDDTLFRLIALGTDQLQKQGYSRKGSENVVGPMPPMGTVLKAPDDIWKVIAWIRSVNPSSAGGGAGPSASAAPPAPPSAPSAQ